MTYKDRLELNELSKELFGTTGRWRKLLRKGERSVVDLKDYKGYDAKKPKVRMAEIKHYTFDTIKGYLLKIKDERQALLDKMKKSVDDKKM